MIRVSPYVGAGGRSRTGTGLSALGILSPVRLPIPPLRRSREANRETRDVRRPVPRLWVDDLRITVQLLLGGDGRIRTAV